MSATSFCEDCGHELPADKPYFTGFGAPTLEEIELERTRCEDCARKARHFLHLGVALKSLHAAPDREE